ncbi:YiiD C-terminal domain-containing protein [Noviherbaspirillum sp. Root189]|uniref:YiiD C-terminal domain-containing protein n=1 Tax=Noviherbaspirillum sp. Root189 TaxID=1736487 RepID=UPI00070AAE3B|nr:YiiD C-terminal domain-containing protein [Noviherbaspirillum sp. Root189]KRB93774.1 hypothetical protein ASE07_11935 [Noviherbaspirillum sp. Root189]
MNTIQITTLQSYLHRQIPLSQAMGVQVHAATEERVELRAPIGPNINHEATVFGGSASAVAILSAWTLVYLRLQASGLPGRVVIQANNMLYQKPMSAAFSAIASSGDERSWERLFNAVRRGRMARITVQSVLECEGKQAGQLEGTFVVLLPDA